MSKSGYLFGMPSAILYGEGSINRVAEEVKKLGGTNVLLITDEVFLKTGQVDNIRSLLSKAGINMEIYTGVTVEPEDRHIEQGLEILRANACDTVVALGGGSCIDAAKGVALMATNPGKISDYEGRDKVKNKALPFIAISTTAGTGSEISRVAVITDTSRTVKMIVKDEKCRPNIAIDDPELTISMPPSVTAASGMDALTHAIEGYISRESQPMTELLALHAVRLITNSLPIAWANGKDLKARSDMMLGQLLAGMTFSNASTCTVHGLARPLGAHFHVTHGLANAMFLVEGMEFTLPACPEKFAKIAEAMGENIKGLTVYEAAEKAVEAVRKLRKIIKIPTLTEYGLDREQVIKLAPVMAEDGIASGSHNLNPRTPTKEDLITMYKKAL